MILVKITETDVATSNPLHVHKREFHGKTADADLQKYLELLHKTKMDKACNKAGIGHYTPSKLTRPSTFSRVAGARDATRNYPAVQQEITTHTCVEITHV